MSWPFADFSSAPGYQQIFDYQGGTSGQPIYVGWATVGASQNSPVWKIRKFTYDANNQILKIQFANGDVGFKSVWANRTGYTYS